MKIACKQTETTGSTETRSAHIRAGRLFVKVDRTSQWIGSHSSETEIYDYTLSELHAEILCDAHGLDMADGDAPDAEQVLADMELEDLGYLEYSGRAAKHFVRRKNVGCIVK